MYYAYIIRMFFFCNDVCFTEDMFTVSGSSSSGDLDDKNSPFTYILLLYLCIYTLMTSTNMYKKNNPPPIFCVCIIFLSVWFQDIIFPPTKEDLIKYYEL